MRALHILALALACLALWPHAGARASTSICSAPGLHAGDSFSGGSQQIPNACAATPKSILGADLVAWLRADMGVTLNSTTVSSWADQSGNGNSFLQATGANQPIFVASSAFFGGRPAIQFVSASTTHLDCASFTDSYPNQVLWWWIVVYANNGGSYGLTLSSTSSSAIEIGTRQLGITGLGAVVNGDLAASGGNVNTSAFAYHGYVRNNGGNSYDGATSKSNAALTTQNESGTNFGTFATGRLVKLGARASDNFGPYNGYFAEVVVANAVPSTAQIAALYAYGAARYGSVAF